MSFALDNNWNWFSTRNWFWCIAVLWLGQFSILAGSVSLTWNPSPDTNAVGYNVYFGGTSGDYTNVLSVGSVTNVTIIGLTEGVTYYFSATTVSSLGIESAFCSEVSYVIPLSDISTTITSAPANVSLPPTLNSIANLTINQNAGLQKVNLTGISAGTSGNTNVNVYAVSSDQGAIISAPVVNYINPDSNGTLIFTPVSGAAGTATVTVTVDNGGTTNNPTTQTFIVTVTPAPVATINSSSSLMQTIATTVVSPPTNQPPTLSLIQNISVVEGSGSQVMALTGITSGLVTATNKIKVTATSSNTRLVPNPTINYTNPASTAVLTLQPSASDTGTATITVTVNNGAKSNNTVQRSFSVSIVTQPPPTLNPIGNLTVTDGAAAQRITLTGISAGCTMSNPNLKVSAKSSNGRLIANPTVQYTNPGSTAVLKFIPPLRGTGTATVTVTVSDSAKRNNSTYLSFVVTVTAPTNSQAAVAPTSVVQPDVAAALSAVSHANNQFSFQVTGVSGQKYAVQTTSDLILWTSVETNTAPFTFRDKTVADSGQRFYRAKSIQ